MNEIRKDKYVRGGDNICPICGSGIHLVGNDEYEEDGNRHLYQCAHCGASIEVYEPLDEEKAKYPFWKEQET